MTKGIVYYTDNRVDEVIARRTRSAAQPGQRRIRIAGCVGRSQRDANHGHRAERERQHDGRAEETRAQDGSHVRSIAR